MLSLWQADGRLDHYPLNLAKSQLNDIPLIPVFRDAELAHTDAVIEIVESAFLTKY